MAPKRHQKHVAVNASAARSSAGGSSEATRIKAMFAQADTNGDGSLDFREFQALFLKLNASMTRHECRILFKQVDKDGNNRIDFDEFVDYMYAYEKSEPPQSAPVAPTGVMADSAVDKPAVASTALVAHAQDVSACDSFEDLRIGGHGCSIPKAEERAITLPQLQALFEYISRRCLIEEWVSCNPANPCMLTSDSINLYDVVHHVVKVVTRAGQTSYVEFIADAAQVPFYFVSHWWGEPLADFIACLKKHSWDRRLQANSPYWVCAYANNQWALSVHVCDDPASTSFKKAMQLARGTVSVLDREATCYTRVWCGYEVYVSLLEGKEVSRSGEVTTNAYTYDMYIAVGEHDAVGITDGFAEVDQMRDDVYWKDDKFAREKTFPTALARSVLTTRLQDAKASQESDKVHILNTIVGAADLNAVPPQEHERYESLNSLLRGRFALATWRLSFENGENMSSHCAALKASNLEAIEMIFDGCEHFDDGTFRSLCSSIPFTVKRLDLDFAGQKAITDSSVHELGDTLEKCEHLSSLSLRFGHCTSVTSLNGLGKGLSKLQALTFLNLYAGDAVSLTAFDEFSRSLARHQNIATLKLHFPRCPGIKSLVALGSAVRQMNALTVVLLDFRGCSALPSKLNTYFYKQDSFLSALEA